MITTDEIKPIPTHVIFGTQEGQKSAVVLGYAFAALEAHKMAEKLASYGLPQGVIGVGVYKIEQAEGIELPNVGDVITITEEETHGSN